MTHTVWQFESRKNLIRLKEPASSHFWVKPTADEKIDTTSLQLLRKHKGFHTSHQSQQYKVNSDI